MKNLKTKVTLAFLLTGTVIYLSCTSQNSTPTSTPTSTYTTAVGEVNKQISYNLPVDVDVDATQAELANFAWQEFIALNWRSSYNIDQKRTLPDTSWNFETSGTQPDIAIWETYIHRTELRPANGERTRDLSSGKPNYTFIKEDTINNGSIDINNYWNLLDEDNEIGSAYLFAHQNEFEVLYSAKCNLTEYNYIKDNYPNDNLLKAASDNGMNKGVGYFKGLSKADMCNTEQGQNDGVIRLPCSDSNSEGVIEIKLAFRQLDPSKDDLSRYMTKEVVLYRSNSQTKQLDAYVENLALIGMHIIRKTENYPAFVFASFEQVDERDKNMQTIGLDDQDPHELTPVIPRDISNTIAAVNNKMHQQIVAANSSSLWQYYRLIGTQATPVDYSNRSEDENYFMANYVIESDMKLTKFHGSFADPYNDSIQNVAFDMGTYNMGGCQGCHGQAQLQFGTDFSFLLDSGVDKPVPNPDPYQTYEQALMAANPTVALSKEQVKQLRTYIHDLDN